MIRLKGYKENKPLIGYFFSYPLVYINMTWVIPLTQVGKDKCLVKG